MHKQSYENQLSERQQELEDRAEELEAQHEELTAAVEALMNKNESLESTLTELNIRNREIDQIVYRSYHDLKTPITAIEGLLTLLEVDPDEQELYLGKSKDSLKEMKHVIKMLARYSSSLVEEVRNIPVDFAAIWEEVLNDLERSEGFNDVKITFTKPCDSIVSDSERIKLLLYNILKNAIDFRSERARIDVSINSINDNITIQISDNGIGIPVEVQPQVFNMFYRGSSKSKGSGLGLYLCKRTVEILSGKINLISSLGIGTTVRVELPIKKLI